MKNSTLIGIVAGAAVVGAAAYAAVGELTRQQREERCANNAREINALTASIAQATKLGAPERIESLQDQLNSHSVEWSESERGMSRPGPEFGTSIPPRPVDAVKADYEKDQRDIAEARRQQALLPGLQQKYAYHRGRMVELRCDQLPPAEPIKATAASSVTPQPSFRQPRVVGRWHWSASVYSGDFLISDEDANGNFTGRFSGATPDDTGDVVGEVTGDDVVFKRSGTYKGKHFEQKWVGTVVLGSPLEERAIKGTIQQAEPSPWSSAFSATFTGD